MWFPTLAARTKTRRGWGTRGSGWRKEGIMQEAGTIRGSWRGAALAAAAAVGLSVILICPAPAQVSRYDEKQMAQASDKPPAILNGVGIAQRLNEQLPLGLTFNDDMGRPVQ